MNFGQGGTALRGINTIARSARLINWLRGSDISTYQINAVINASAIAVIFLAALEVSLYAYLRKVSLLYLKNCSRRDHRYHVRDCIHPADLIATRYQ
jgi:hypothetical protein